jgi:phosphate/sulfate permease
MLIRRLLIGSMGMTLLAGAIAAAGWGAYIATTFAYPEFADEGGFINQVAQGMLLPIVGGAIAALCYICGRYIETVWREVAQYRKDRASIRKWKDREEQKRSELEKAVRDACRQ